MFSEKSLEHATFADEQEVQYSRNKKPHPTLMPPCPLTLPAVQVGKVPDMYVYKNVLYS